MDSLLKHTNTPRYTVFSVPVQEICKVRIWFEKSIQGDRLKGCLERHSSVGFCIIPGKGDGDPKRSCHWDGED